MMARSQRVPHDDFSLLLLYCYSLLQFERENQIVKGANFATRLVPGRTNLVAVLVRRGPLGGNGCDRH